MTSEIFNPAVFPWKPPRGVHRLAPGAHWVRCGVGHCQCDPVYYIAFGPDDHSPTTSGIFTCETHRTKFTQPQTP